MLVSVDGADLFAAPRPIPALRVRAPLHCLLSFLAPSSYSPPRAPPPTTRRVVSLHDPLPAASSRTAFKLFDAIGVSYRKLNFDSLEYAPDNRGNILRASVQEHTGAVTFPQVFVGGQFIGGAADACMKWKSGELQTLLEGAGAKPEGSEWNGYSGDPFE